MQIINTEGIEPLHVWFMVGYDPSRWMSAPVLLEHYSLSDKYPLKDYYIAPLKGIKIDGNPFDRLSKLLMMLKQRSKMYMDKFYLIECEIPYDFISGDSVVVVPYLATMWIRAIDYLEKLESNGDYFKYSCEVLYENEYRSLLYGSNILEFSETTLQSVVDRVNVLNDPEMSYNCIISNTDLLKSVLIRCQDFSSDSDDYKNMVRLIESDIKRGEFTTFAGNRVQFPVENGLASLKYLWELYFGKEEQVNRYAVNFEDTPEQLINANRVLNERRKEEERAKEKERIRREKEEIARKKRYYGRNADKVDDRIKQDQNSIGWWARWVANKVTFGLVRPPKTIRSDDYREQFMKRNQGLVVKGFYLCIYCGRPIHAKSPDNNHKMFVDHIKPINQGGRNSTWNLGPACFKCNSEKSDKGGEWVLRGYIGKAGYTVLQTASNIGRTLLLGFKEKSKLKKAASFAFYGITGLWLLQLLFMMW